MKSKHPENRQDSLEEAIVDFVSSSGKKLTPLDLEREISASSGISCRTARKAVKRLVLENRLAYTQQMGRTLLEISRNRPVHVGEGVLLAPPETSLVPPSGHLLVKLAPGASFGAGDHPTTRIALRLISRAAAMIRPPAGMQDRQALDIGTGSGVLAIAACLAAADTAVGIDTDPCARSEAAENVRLNRLERKIRITESIEDCGQGPFCLVLANLRYPTLAAMCRKIEGLCAPGAAVILSGFRENEKDDLAAEYLCRGFACKDVLAEQCWCGLMLRKKE